MVVNEEKKNRRKRLANATRNIELFALASAKSQTLWKSMKAQMKTMTPISELWHRSSAGSSEATTPDGGPLWPQDEEEGLFCESLLGLMQKFERYEYLKLESSRLSFARFRSTKQKTQQEKVGGKPIQVFQIEESQSEALGSGLVA
jgi:hypothetical protein